MSPAAFRILTRHFVGSILAPPVLTDLGVDYLRRTLASLLGVLLMIGIFLPRLFFRKYVDLAAEIYPDHYLAALRSDTVLMIALPMLIVGLLSVVVCPMLFPDEMDYRILTPLPMTRTQLFAAKLLALALVVFVAILSVNMIASVWFPFTTGGNRAPHPMFARVSAHAIAALAGSTWMFSAVMALQGISLTLLPQRWQSRVGAALQAAFFLLLLLSIPLVLRISTMAVNSDTVMSWPLMFMPPTWFFGVEQWLLDREAVPGGYAAAAWMALVATVTTVSFVVGSYALLYRSAERLAGASAGPTMRSTTGAGLLTQVERRAGLRAPTAAVLSLAWSGVTRSRLHQFVFLLIVGVGLALLIDQIATVMEGRTLFAARPRAAIHAAIAAPLLVALCGVLALRTVFLLPLDREAAWAFRITEDQRTRPLLLNGVVGLFTICATVPTLALALVLQPNVLGSSWVVAALFTMLASLVLVEVVLADWLRIPFTCSYLPGKRVMAYTLGVLFTAYAVFVYIGANLIRWSLLHPARTMMLGGALLATFATLRRARLRTWGTVPLEFEDEDPTAVRSLGVLADERQHWVPK
jgi:hypothetical protein